MEWPKQLEIPILFLYVLIVNMKVVIGVKKVRIFYLKKNNNRFVMYFNIDRTSRYCYKTDQIYSMLYGKTTI